MGAQKTRLTAAIGFRAHSGWAALVAVAGPITTPTVVERKRIELADRSIPGSVQPYHAAEGSRLKDAEKFIDRCVQSSTRLARQAIESTLKDLQEKGYKVTSCGLLLSSAKPLPELAAILTSHALIHTAEGEMFRDVLVNTAGRYGLSVLKVRERELFD